MTRSSFFGLLAVAVSWNVVVSISADSMAGFFFLYPLWNLLLVCILLDLGYRLLNRPPTLLAIPAGAAIGLLAGIANLLELDELSFFLMPIVSALSGAAAGVLVIGAETKQLRDD